MEKKSDIFLFFACILSVICLMVMANQEPENATWERMAFQSRPAPELLGYWVEIQPDDFSEVELPRIENKKQSEPKKTKQEWLVDKTGAKEEIAARIVRETRNYEHGDLLLAILSVESDARPNLKHGNNYGLCQVSTVHFGKEEQKRLRKLGHKTIRDCGVHSPADLYDIRKNICAANSIFERILKNADGDYAQALRNYNANPKHKYKYSRKVMRRYKEIKKLKHA